MPGFAEDDFPDPFSTSYGKSSKDASHFGFDDPFSVPEASPKREKKHQFDDPFSITEASPKREKRDQFDDPFSVTEASPKRENNNADNSGFGKFGWKGFGKSSAFETIASGWETEDDDDDDDEDEDESFNIAAPSSLSSKPRHSPTQSEWSDTSPTGIAEFQSAGLSRGKVNKDFPSTNLFSAGSSSQWR